MSVKLELPDCVAAALLKELINREETEDERKENHLEIALQALIIFWINEQQGGEGTCSH